MLEKLYEQAILTNQIAVSIFQHQLMKNWLKSHGFSLCLVSARLGLCPGKQRPTPLLVRTRLGLGPGKQRPTPLLVRARLGLGPGKQHPTPLLHQDRTPVPGPCETRARQAAPHSVRTGLLCLVHQISIRYCSRTQKECMV